jgi:hypothetical protein
VNVKQNDSPSKWVASDISNAKPIVASPGLSILEFQDNKDEWHNFDILKTPERLVFGGCCNAGFLESGYILREDGESIDETLTELLSDLECYYNNGPQYVSRIVCNERM